MYQEHTCFKLSCSEDSKVWRYIDFTKYVSMLEESTLWFSRADCLIDPFDSEVPNSVIAKMKRGWEQALAQARSVEMPEEIKKAWIQQIEGSRDFMRDMRLRYAVNCWHQNDHESAAMWKLYLKSDEGIAVVSTPRKLIESVRNAPFLMFAGSVEYVDFDNYPFFNNSFSPVMRKRKSFEHEHELRIVAVKEKDGAWSPEAFEGNGVSIKVNVPQLIEAIYVSPTAQAWVARLVEQVARRFNLACDIRRSSLAERPLW